MNATTSILPSITVKQEKLHRYEEVRRKSVAWLLTHLHADGALGDPREGFFFYRAPWTFAITGEVAAANAVCGWMRRNMITNEGAIDGPYRAGTNDAFAYRDSAFMIGAHYAGQYDVSYGLMPNLLSWQDPHSGAFANDRLPDGSKSDDMDLPYTVGPGIACIAIGHVDAARAVYRHLERLYAAQTELPNRFYYTWSRARQAVITEFPVERQFWYLVDNQVARTQRWTIGGIAAGFLCHLYLTEPKAEYLELARKYQAFSMQSTPEQFNFPQVCKSSWGSSLLYQITGEEQYLAWTYKLGDWYADTQNVDGYWDRWYPDPDTPIGTHIHLVLEFVLHINTLMGGLASRT